MRMQFDRVRRREFLTLLSGAAAAWPLAAHTQQPAMPAVGYLNAGFHGASTVTTFRRRLADAGYLEGRDVTIDYRFAEGQYERLPAMAEELVRPQARAPRLKMTLAV
jgi:putative ABC transport system substrate-binding protein